MNKEQILEKSHSLIADVSTTVWDSLSKEDMAEDSLTLAYINGVTELTDSLIRLLDEESNPINEELAEYKYLEEQGLLLKIPCKIGDTIYVIGTKCEANEDITEGYCDTIDCDECQKDKEFTIYKRKVDSFYLASILGIYQNNIILNEKVFLTKEAAKKKFAEKNHELSLGQI